jgi:nucleoside-diphosphate-sugar epimerase
MDKPVVLVTGSSGYLGYHACVRLAEGYRVVAFDRPGAPHPPETADEVACDLTNDDSVRSAVEYVRQTHGRRLASVIHLAAYYNFSGEPSPMYEQLTVRGTERVLRNLGDFHVGQFVFSSTMLVHAPCRPGQRMNEDWPLLPRWDYPRSKVAAEGVIHERRRNIPVVILRIGGVYDDKCHSVPLSHQIQRIYERRLTARVFPGDVYTGQSFVHLDDVTELLWRVVERRAALPPQLTLLVGEPETLSYDELQRTFGWLIHGDPDWDTAQIPKAVAKTGAWVQDRVPGFEDPFIKPWMIDLADDHYALDVRRAREQAGWEPARALRAALRKMVEFLKSDPTAFYRENGLEASPPMPSEPAGVPAHLPHAS